MDPRSGAGVNSPRQCGEITPARGARTALFEEGRAAAADGAKLERGLCDVVPRQELPAIHAVLAYEPPDVAPVLAREPCGDTEIPAGRGEQRRYIGAFELGDGARLRHVERFGA